MGLLLGFATLLVSQCADECGGFEGGAADRAVEVEDSHLIDDRYVVPSRQTGRVWRGWQFFGLKLCVTVVSIVGKLQGVGCES